MRLYQSYDTFITFLTNDILHLKTFTILNVKFTVHIKARKKVAVASSLIFLSLQLLTYHPVQNQVVVICLLNQQHAKNFSTKNRFGLYSTIVIVV